ncbi:hypothetical protein PV325_002929 [Microctonus aethiopoides]|nr:hypothetical protein PV325_002929 [Microctonus aethiopoides]
MCHRYTLDRYENIASNNIFISNFGPSGLGLRRGYLKKYPTIGVRCHVITQDWKIYDARNGQQGKVKLWSDPLFWGSRAIFRLGPPAQLQIQDVRPTDEAVYRCRIDFRNSPTRNMKVNFTVIRTNVQPQPQGSRDEINSKPRNSGSGATTSGTVEFEGRYNPPLLRSRF